MFPLLRPCLYRLLPLLPLPLPLLPLLLLLLPLPLARLRAWGCTRRRLGRLRQHLHQHHCHWNRRCQLSMTAGS